MSTQAFTASPPLHPGLRIPEPTRFLGRQPIFDAQMRLYGYELLFRSGLENCFSGMPEDATRRVLDSYLLLTADTQAGLMFVNCTRDALVSKLVTLLPPSCTVLEILEDVPADPSVMAACRDLARRGYRFALDDFSPDPAREPLVELADYVKVDFRSADPAERRLVYDMVRRSHIGRPKPRLIAEKVETESEVALARAEGHQLFQGYFFSRPTVVAQRDIPPNRAVYVRLLVALARVPTDINEVERLVMAEASLTFRLLRLVNSALFGLTKEVTSVRSALVMAGEQEFRKLVTVAMAGVLAEHQPQMLVSIALERARFCELLAPQLNQDASEQYLLGMLSLVDAILQAPMHQLVDSLPLRSEVKDALLGKPSRMTMPLDLIRSYETGDWKGCNECQKEIGLSDSSVTEMYLESVRWARDITDSTARILVS